MIGCEPEAEVSRKWESDSLIIAKGCMEADSRGYSSSMVAMKSISAEQ
jgi:hypothetical protein